MQNNNIFLQKQIKLLHRRNLPDSVLKNITKFKKIAYEYLLNHVNDSNLSEYQVINIMKILFIMRNYDGNTFINKILVLIKDERIEIRSYASVILVTLLYLDENFSGLNFLQQKSKEEFLLILKQAVELEISPKVITYVQNYINKH
jgi:hypothetical protein